jgi:hypothetical protein
MSPTLLEAQTSALLSLLNLNEQQHPSTSSQAGSRPQTPANNQDNSTNHNDLLPFEKGKSGPLVWKVLILDEQSKDVLATSLRVQDLREQGVTLHMCVTCLL